MPIGIQSNEDSTEADAVVDREMKCSLRIIISCFTCSGVLYEICNALQDEPPPEDPIDKTGSDPLAYVILLYVVKVLVTKTAEDGSLSMDFRDASYSELAFIASSSRRRMAFSAKTPFGSGGIELLNTDQSLEPHDGMILQVVEKGTFQHQYELEQLVHTELGVSVKHVTDFAYTPVETEISPEFSSSEATGLVEEAIPLDWWSWWLPRKDWKTDGGFYQMNSQAFAGGSHGEVWGGRRRCRTHTESRLCGKKLVFKRLRVEKGFQVLEAGLREVYFGRLVNRKVVTQEQGNLFTRYADHFFREQSGKLELWIVFEDAGSSLRSYMYTGSLVGDHVVYQQSSLWQKMRFSVLDSDDQGKNSYNGNDENADDRDEKIGGDERLLMRSILLQVLTSVSRLHENGIVLRDLKPSNIICTSNYGEKEENEPLISLNTLKCVVGDFSSAWDPFVGRNLYTHGPTRNEQTDEYAPPEAIFGVYNETIVRPSFDSWSIGILALELLLGCAGMVLPNLTYRRHFTCKYFAALSAALMFLNKSHSAALSQFCIYDPTRGHRTSSIAKMWPLRSDDASAFSGETSRCTIADFHVALRARDPLGIGFDSSMDPLLHLIWQLLEFYPNDRITAAEALQHPYFTGTSLSGKNLHAVESQMLDPRFDFVLTDFVSNFRCPKCGKSFRDWQSCHMHTNARKHGRFCEYDKAALPRCISTHSLLPPHSKSGYCGIQGRRKVIEDFHTIHLFPSHQFYGIFDGHLGNLASKFVAASLYDELVAKGVLEWPNDVKLHHEIAFRKAFVKIHEKFLKAVHMLAHDTMDQSGTTATVMLVSTRKNDDDQSDDSTVYVFANLGDSRAVLGSRLTEERVNWIQITRDHVADDADEQNAIKRRGGFVQESGGIARVNGTLAVSRSIGDADLSSFLSQEPDVTLFTRKEIEVKCGGSTRHCFVVLASDGLWDVMTNVEVVELVGTKLLESTRLSEEFSQSTDQGFQLAAESLVHEAYIRGSTDNIGVCVVGL